MNTDEMTTDEILARRDQLRAELTNAHAAEHEARRAIHAAEADTKTADAARMAAFQEAARQGGGLKPKEVVAAENAYEDATGLVDSLNRQLASARRAQVQVQVELDVLLRDEIGTFMEEAESATRAAMTALDALAPHYQAARSAWTRAQVAWTPLRQALVEQIEEKKAADGIHADRSATQRSAVVPDWSAQEPDFFISMPSPRPAALTDQPEIEVIEG